MSSTVIITSDACVQVADKRLRDPTKRSVLEGRCKQPEGIVCDTPYHPRCPTDPTEVIPDTDTRPVHNSQISFDSSRCKRYLDFGVQEAAVGFSQRAHLGFAPDFFNWCTTSMFIVIVPPHVTLHSLCCAGDLEIMSECNQVVAQPVREGTIFAQYAHQV